jgi:hypothetical protein
VLQLLAKGTQPVKKSSVKIRAMSPSRRSNRSRLKSPAWADLSDEELMQVRLKDLKVTIAGTWLEDCMDQLHEELQDRNIPARAHAWLADEWFSPHDTPGIAIPFYLAHPRLARLERKMMLEVEGGTVRECMRILRHEMGHVMQRLYGLHRRKKWRDLFGPSSVPYPEHYRPNPMSRRFVQHLRRWYAQCHPDEDFAETFAVWLAPRSNWRKRYANWPALQKLQYIDELMEELSTERPPAKKRIEIDPVDTPSVFDRELLRIFSNDTRHRDAPLAATMIRRNSDEIRRSVARWSGEFPLAIEAAIEDIADRARILKLRAPGSEQRMRLELTALLSTKAVHALYSASRRQSFAGYEESAGTAAVPSGPGAAGYARRRQRKARFRHQDRMGRDDDAARLWP